ncbi:FAD dependent oxidoreductase [Cerioporus squamosus]|nr:FAD dependent oxidoreductase [Cerioporus squamosus]
MGGLVSKAKLIYYATVKLGETYDLLKARLETPPGLPVENPTLPLWTVPAARIPADPTGPLPDDADIVIIGSGITGTSFAYNALTRDARPRIVMLEARDVCSGATGRNGGHINPPLYHDYSELKGLYGEHAAKVVIAFRRSHITELQRVASVEDILKESQCRETEHLDVFTCPKAFATAKDNLAKWRAEMPSESSTFLSHEREEAIQKYHLSDQVVGCISNSGGAMHPYRFVTSLLSILISRHPSNFRIFTHTPCTSITSANGTYIVHTSNGSIRTPHVVHATNGWSSELLRPLVAKIAPARGGMSAQRPGTTLHTSTLSGMRSFVFYRGSTGYDYLTQLPTGEHELMFGGGWAMACDDSRGLPEIGIADDSVVNHVGQSYLAGALPQYFGMRNWGEDAKPGGHSPVGEEKSLWGQGRTKAQWSGILGISADMLPWVGRLPEKVAGRASPKSKASEMQGKAENEQAKTAAPGEWIAAGYTGEGMVHAWMSGKALAHMKRWKEANMEKLFERFM